MTITDNSIGKHILDLSKKLIAIKSTGDNPHALHEALHLVKKEIEAYYPIEEFESNGIPSLLIHNTSQRTKHFKIILTMHLDVVPAKDPLFYPREEHGKLFGRGAYDMKAAGAVFTLLFKELGKTLSYPLGLQVVTDEENMGHNGAEYQIKKGIRCDFAVSGENSELHIKNRTKGLIWIRLTAQGKLAHGAYLWKGDNAMWKLLSALQKIKMLYPIPHKETWETTVNLSRIETPNNVFNNVPDKASAFLDFRVTPEDRDTLLRRIQDTIGDDIHIDVLTNDPAQFTDPNNTYVTLLQKEVEYITNKPSHLISSHAPSDIRHFNVAGYPGVEFGPVGNGQHSDNEWVDVKSLLQYYYILKRFLLSAQDISRVVKE